MEFTAKQIAELLEGEVVGNEEAAVSNVAKIEEGTPGKLSFLANPKYTQYIYSTEASIVIVSKDFVPEKEVKTTLIKVEDAYQSFAKLLEIYNSYKNNKLGIEDKSYISESATIGDEPYIGAFAYIGENVKIGNNVKIYPNAYIGDNVVIGDNSKINPNVTIYHDTVIGESCTIHAGVTIGADGFGFAPSDNGYDKVAQIGNVVIEDNVEIGAGATIDRATMGSTFIRKGVKIDNMVQIAHNVDVGDHTVIAAQTGIAGTVKIGKRCMIGGQVGISGHVSIADETMIAAQSGISHDIKEPKKILMGSPAFNISDYRKSNVLFKRLPDIYKSISNLEKLIKEKLG